MEVSVNNEPEQIELRRLRSRLHTIGAGVIVMSLWSLFKSLLFYISGSITDSVQMVADQASTGTVVKSSAAGIMIMSAVILIFDLSIRTYAGFSAIAISRGERRGRAFVFCTILLILGSAMTIVLWIISFYQGLRNNDAEMMKDLTVSTLVVEITSLILLAEMLASAGKVRKLTKNGVH